MRHFLKVCCLVSGIAMLGGCSDSSPSVPYSATIAEGRLAVQEVMAETGATSVTVALVNDSGVIWSEAFGVADRNTGRSTTTGMLYGACSVSKMLATVAAMILVDRGLISLDEPVKTYIPGFTMPLDARYQNITVRMLLNHSSGLPGNDMRGAVTLDAFTGNAAQTVDGFKYARLKNAPGTVSAYNNDGFTMIETLVKAVTGLDYPDFVQQNILNPLGMSSSRYQTTAIPADAYVRSYGADTLLPLYFFNIYASGGLFSTPEELSRLAIMMINRGVYGSSRILSSASVAAMAVDQRAGTFNPVPNESMRFGLGWDTVAQPGLAAVGVLGWEKTGDMSGYYGANISVAPDEKLGVVVFGASNSFGSSHAVKISERILLRALVETGRLGAMPQKLSTDDLEIAAVTAAEKSAFTGFYASSNGAYRLSFGAGDTLLVEEYRTDWTTKYQNFKLRSDGWYAADGDPVTGLQLLTRAGHNYFALRQSWGYGHYSITVMMGQQLDAEPAVSAAWQARLGERWLPVNADPWYFTANKTNAGFGLRTITGLTGYLMGSKIMRDMAAPSNDRLDGMFLNVTDGIRDLQDAGIEIWNAQNWLRLGSYLYRPLSGIALLAPGVSTVTIGSDGFSEWRSLPASGTLSISGTTYWYLYDSDLKELASGATSGAPAFSGSGAKYLVLFGPGGANINLNLAP